MITVTDIFAGAGGSTTGMTHVPGVEIRVAANHWKLAIDVHQENHPDTDHAHVDLHLEDPRNFPRTDILWASPECTKWSIANSKAKALSQEMGGDPTLFDHVPVELESTDDDEATRSRLLMFDVLRFVEHHRYRAVIVENVVDVATQPKYARAWQAWQGGLRKLGYRYRVVSLNSMHAQLGGDPAPQSRDRLYVVAWPVGEHAPRIDDALSPSAFCQRCEAPVRSRQAWKPGRTVGRYRAQYVYACPHCGDVVEPGWLPASTIIDWSLPADRIADRKRPLSEKTMARIREGLRRYGTSQPLIQRHNTSRSGPGGEMMTPVSEPIRTLTTAGHQSIVTPTKAALLVPVEGRSGKVASTVAEPLRTQTTRNETALLVPYYSASETAKPISDPIGTLTTVDRYALITLRGTNTPKPITAALDTITASGNHHGLMSITEDDVMACRFRMLEPAEIAAGMSFPADYRWQGTKRERVRLAGNAVTPPAARDLLMVVADSIRGAA